MKKYTKYMIGKIGIIITHFIAFAVFITAVSLIYANDNFKKGIGWVNSETYENSPGFTKQVEEDIEHVFNYIRLRDVFEANGVLDIYSNMFSINIGPGKDKIYSMQDVINLASEKGYYMDADYRIKKDTSAETEDIKDIDLKNKNFSPDDSYLVNWRSYVLDEKINEPGDKYMTIDTLIMESIESFNQYYDGYSRLYLNPCNFKYKIIYDDLIYTNEKTLDENTVKNYGRYSKLDSAEISAQNNFKFMPSNIVYLASQSAEAFGSDYKAYIAVDTSFPEDDAYRLGNEDYIDQRNIYFYGMIISAVALFFMLMSLVFMFVTAGTEYRKSKEYKLFQIDRIAVESNLLICVFAIIVLLFITEKAGVKILHVYLAEKHWMFGERMMQYVAIYICILFTTLSIVRGAKAKIIWKNSLIKKIWQELRIYDTKHSYSMVLIVNFGIYFILNTLIGFAVSRLFFDEAMLVQRFIGFGLMIVFLLFNALTFHFLYKKAAQNDKLEIAVKSISGGDTAYKLELSDFTGKEAEVARSINNISYGLENAINVQVKSERMKADLITNVSHDIKTPLTSIINYVDLIKREKPDNPKIREYVEILEKKSHHLKTLTEDLVEASKVSSGNVSVELGEIDLVAMIQQTNGEFEEKYDKKSLTIVSELPPHSLVIEADGRHLWRILENLYNNAYKYAIIASRVYVSIKEEDEKAVFTIKNVSQHPLNISPEELTERFVRGDVSRTTEGSGLGLSIAKSLTVLQGGKFEIQIDGDLFKVLLIFPLAAGHHFEKRKGDTEE